MESAGSPLGPEDAPEPVPPAFLLRQPAAPRAAATSRNAPDDLAGRPAAIALLDAVEAAQAPPDLPLVIEALLLAAEEPPTVSHLARATYSPPDAVEAALETLERAAAGRGVRLQRAGAQVRLVTAPQAAPFVQRLLGLERPNRLSRAALETLAIVAYQQPVTRGAIERVRGVSCDAPLATLRGRELITSVGQADTPGRPHLWATTPRFLEHFGLRGLEELPSLPEPLAAAAPSTVDPGGLAASGD